MIPKLILNNSYRIPNIINNSNNNLYIYIFILLVILLVYCLFIKYKIKPTKQDKINNIVKLYKFVYNK